MSRTLPRASRGRLCREVVWRAGFRSVAIELQARIDGGKGREVPASREKRLAGLNHANRNQATIPYTGSVYD